MCFSDHIRTVHTMDLAVCPLTSAPEALPYVKETEKMKKNPPIICSEGMWYAEQEKNIDDLNVVILRGLSTWRVVLPCWGCTTLNT